MRQSIGAYFVHVSREVAQSEAVYKYAAALNSYIVISVACLHVLTLNNRDKI